MLGVRCPHCKKMMGLESEAGDQVHCPYCRGPFRIPGPAPGQPAPPPVEEPFEPILPDDLAPVDESWRQPHPLGVGRLRHEDMMLPVDLLGPQAAAAVPPAPAPPPPRPAPGIFPLLELDAPDPVPPLELETPDSLPLLELETSAHPPPPPEPEPAPVPTLELADDVPVPAPVPEPEPPEFIPFAVADPEPPAEPVPLTAVQPVEEPRLAPLPDEDVPLARLDEPVPEAAASAHGKDYEVVEEDDEEALTVAPPAPRREKERRPRRKQPRAPAVEVREPLWMQPPRDESPVSRNRLVGGGAVLLGVLLLIYVCAGGHLFNNSAYLAGYALVCLLGLALLVGGVFAIIRG